MGNLSLLWADTLHPSSQKPCIEALMCNARRLKVRLTAKQFFWNNKSCNIDPWYLKPKNNGENVHPLTFKWCIKIGYNTFALFTDNDKRPIVWIVYHRTPIVQFYSEYIKIVTDGYQDYRTTRDRINALVGGIFRCFSIDKEVRFRINKPGQGLKRDQEKSMPPNLTISWEGEIINLCRPIKK